MREGRELSLTPVASSIQASRLFDAAVAALMGVGWRPELVVEEIPAPQRIAPYAVAIGADVQAAGTELGNGRLVLLHDPAGNPAWDGAFRCVTYARAFVDSDMVFDPLLPVVGWSWLMDALQRHRADHCAPSGTVTSVASQSFGSMADEPPRAEVEIRASWTPLVHTGPDIAPHVDAWQDLLCMVAGLPPLPEGVVAMPTPRPATWRR